MRTHAARVEAARGWAAMARDLNSPSRSLHREDLIDDRTRRLGRLHGPQLGDRVCTRWLANARRNLLGGLVAKNFQGHQGTVPLLALPCARKGCESNGEQGFDTKGAISADSSEKARCATMFRGRGRMGAREFDFMSAHPFVSRTFSPSAPPTLQCRASGLGSLSAASWDIWASAARSGARAGLVANFGRRGRSKNIWWGKRTWKEEIFDWVQQREASTSGKQGGGGHGPCGGGPHVHRAPLQLDACA